MGGKKVANDTVKTKTIHENVGKIAEKVAGISNGLNTNDAHLKVSRIQEIFQIYDDLTKLVSSYGDMAKHDVVEFSQVSVNIETTDKEAKG